MTKLCSSLLFVLLISTANADENLFGSWQSEDGTRYDFLDGFKPNAGAVILYEKFLVSGVGKWSTTPDSKELKIGYRSSPYDISADGKSLTWGPSYSKKTYKKVAELKLEQMIDLKKDPDAFIQDLTGFIWSNYASKIGETTFTRTFSSTEGVRTQFDKENQLRDLSAWGVASGVLKIGSTVYLEARITPSYLLAMDKRDNFIVLKRGKSQAKMPRTALKDAREKFLISLTTGAWQIPRTTPLIYRFRPLEGDLKGLVFEETDNKLTSTAGWEFSAATGAIKIRGTEYPGGLVIGQLLVFVRSNGDQKMYYRDDSVDKKHFTTADTRTIALSERTAPEVVEAIGRQLSVSDTFYLFEFNVDGRTGFRHEWQSKPFQITAENLKISDYYTYKKMYLVEDYVALGDRGTAFKIDTRVSRLRPKSDAEAKTDAEKASNELTVLREGGVKLVITRTDGSVERIKLPLKSLEGLKSMEVVVE